MPIDLDAAEAFLWSAARLVDRHRYAMLFAGAPAGPVLAALSGYRNDDGGFGHALEPDLRCPGSQPAATLYALEMLHEAGALDGEMARGARAWIASIAEPDGGIPFVLPGYEAYPHSFWWAPQPGSFLTFALAAVLWSGGALGDEWLERATGWCWRAIEAAESPSGYAEVRVRVPRRGARRGARAGGDRVAGRTRRRERDRAGRRRGGGGVATAGPLAAAGLPHAAAARRVRRRGAPRRGGGRPGPGRRLDVRLAGVVAGADRRLARRGHDPRAELAA